MTNWLLNIGFAALCLLPLLGFTSQDAKLNTALWLALILCLRALYKRSLTIRNIPLLMVLGLLPFSIWYGIGAEYKPYLTILVYVAMYAGLDRETAQKSLRFVLWCACVMALYGLLQWLGFESFSTINAANRHAISTPSWQMGAFIGNPTYLGAFLAMLVPLTIREGLKDKRYFGMTALFFVVVMLTRADMAIGAMLCSLVAIPFMMSRKMFVLGSIIGIGLITSIILSWPHIRPHIHDSGRFNHWKIIVQEMNKGVLIKHIDTGEERQKKFSLFGMGGGTYKKTFTKRIIKENFNTCHNEYLQIFVEFGIITLIGFLLFLLIELFKGYDIFTKASLICICLNAVGLFVWQLGITQFLSVYLLCLNKSEVG